MKKTELKRIEKELLALLAKKTDAIDNYNDAVKAAAKKTECKPGALKKYLAAVAKGEGGKAKTEASDLMDLLEDIEEAA